MDIATLGLRVDSSGIMSADEALDRLIAKSALAEAAAKQLAAAGSAGAGAANANANALNNQGNAAATAATKADAFLAKLKQQVDTFGKSSTEILAYRANLLGVAAGAATLISQLESLQTAQRNANQAAAEAAATQAEIARAGQAADTARYSLIEGLREQIATFGLAGTSLVEYKAELLGISADVAPLIAQLKNLEQSQSELAQRNKEAAAAQAAINAANREAEAAAARLADQGNRLVASLAEQIATFGMTSAELSSYRAGLLGVAGAADPLIKKLSELQLAQKELSAQEAESAAAQAQIESAMQSVDTERYNLIQGLHEQIDTFGLAGNELIEYKARLLGIADSADPLIKNLEELNREQSRLNKTQSEEISRNRFVASLKEQAETAGFARSELLEYRAAQLGVTRESADFITKIREQERSLRRQGNQFNESGKSAGELAQALRLVPAQLSDIFVSLVSGQPAYLVAIQQGAQLADSFGGISDALRAIGGLFNPVKVGIAAAIAALGALAYGFLGGRKESDEFARSIILTGNAAGTSVDQLNELADSLDSLQGVTQYGAAKILTALVGTARVSGEDLERFAATTLTASRSLGIATEDIVQNFAELGKDPVGATLKLNESMNYLTASVFRQITALQEQGNEIDAAKLAQDAYADALDQRGPQMEAQLGLIQRGWRNVKENILEARDALLELGREDDGPSTLERIGNILQRVAAQRFSGPGALFAAQEQSAAGPSIDKAADDAAKAEAERVKIQKDAVAAIQENKKWTDLALTSQEKLTAALKKYRDGIEAQRKAGSPISAAQQAKEEAALIKSFAETTTNSSTLSIDVEAIKRELSALTGAYQNAERLLDANRQAGLVSDAAYFESKREYVRLNSEAEQRAIQDEIVRLGQERATGKDQVEIANKVADAYARLAMVKADSAAQSTILNQKEQVLAETQRRQSAQAEAESVQRLATQAREYQRQLDSFGRGPKQARFDAGVNPIEDSASQERNAATRDNLLGRTTDDQYAEELSRIEKFRADALDQWSQYFSAIEEKRTDFDAGWNESFAGYLDGIANVGVALAGDFIGAIENARTGIADIAAETALWGSSGTEAIYALSRSIATDLLSSLISAGLQYIINKTAEQGADVATAATKSAAIGATTIAATGAMTTLGLASAGVAAAIASAWAPAAAAVSLASFGSNAPAAAAGITSTYALTQALSSSSGLTGAVAGGRMNGGQVSAGKIYDFAENGMPELIQIGNKVMLGMGNKDGNVIPMRSASSNYGGGMPSVTFIDQSSGIRATPRSMSDGELVMLIEDRDAQTEFRAVQSAHALAINDVGNRKSLGRTIERRNGLRPKPARGMR